MIHIVLKIYEYNANMMSIGLLLLILTSCLTVYYHTPSSSCWMSLPAMYFSFSLPAAIIVLTNLVIYVMVVVSLTRSPRLPRQMAEAQALRSTDPTTGQANATGPARMKGIWSKFTRKGHAARDPAHERTITNIKASFTCFCVMGECM